MKKGKKAAIGIVSSVAAVTLAGFIGGSIFVKQYKPSVTIDFSKQSEITGCASGFLYGFAEADIPSRRIAESIGITGLAAKPVGGLQHPIGDTAQVADTFFSAGGKMLMIYTQDMYDTWYYQLDSIEEYNKKIFKTVSQSEKNEYRDAFSYCIYNEPDNGEWFGDFSKKESREKFYEAWHSAYDTVKSINKNAKTAGPGFMRYNGEYLKEFLAYCKEAGCMPNTVVWHELGGSCLYLMDSHFEDYYKICDELKIERLPVCISEYGLMSTNGIPGESLKWINRLERQDAYGCVAYWRLANNLSDTVTDDITPNSNYWVYKFYADMKGKELLVSEKDILHSNMGKFLLRQAPLSYKGFSAYASFDEADRKIYMLAGGTDRNGKITVENIDSAAFPNGTRLAVNIKSVDFKGLGGKVIAPTELRTKAAYVENSKIEFTLPCERSTTAYLIEISETDEAVELLTESDPFPSVLQRYEAENAKTKGNAFTVKNPAYACSGGKIVKGIDKNSCIEFEIDIPQDGRYILDFVYGCGAVSSEGNDSRITAAVTVSADGEEQSLEFPSTIKDEYTDCIESAYTFTKGKHTIKIEVKNDAVLSLDFIDVSPAESRSKIYFEKLATRGKNFENTYTVITDRDGEYKITLSNYEMNGIVLNGVKIDRIRMANNTLTLNLPRGYNKIEFLSGGEIEKIKDITPDPESSTFNRDIICITPDDVTLFNGAAAEDDAFTLTGKRIGRIDSDKKSGCEFTAQVPESGYYHLTVKYANNEEGGAHAYNVDLVERYICIDINGKAIPKVFFRSTYSWENYKTKTIAVYLEKGVNTFRFTNDGSYSFNGKTTYAPNIGLITISPI